MVLVVASASLACAVMPTASPTLASSATFVGRSVTVADGRDVELVDIVDGDGERACLECIGAGGPHGNRRAAPLLHDQSRPLR